MSRLQQIIQARQDKLTKIKELGVNPYPPRFEVSHHVADCQLNDQVTLAGRLMGYRRQGKLAFADLQDKTGKLQLFFSQSLLGEDDYQLVKLLDIGDFIGVSGTMINSKTGQLTLEVKTLTLLSKSIFPLPDTWYGLKDKEDRFRKRYLDLLLNSDSKKLLDARWKIEQEVRKFMWSQDYQEVETPILQNLYGGTNAKPFTTHLNSLDQDMYLRVAPELYLKRLVVGGYERIFEIARNFRNEGMDQTHQPEFTMMEFYEAYADYHRMMDLTEDLVKYLAQKLNHTLQLQVGNQTVDLAGKWPRIPLKDLVKQHLKLDWDTVDDSGVQQLLSQHHLQVTGVYTKAKALFTLFDHLVTPKLIQPTWVIDYPIEVSPLAKAHRHQKGFVERFEGYVGGKEMFDGWSEIVNPQAQRDRFNKEQRNLKAGDDEAQPLDEDFLEALAYGCPPLGGIGVGIDRLVMFLTNTWAIREVIAFPLLRPNK